jgi:outer membrane protein assembly factor BamB
VVTGDLLLVGSCSGTFYAFNKRSGQTLWTYNIKQDGNQSSFHGGMVLFDNKVFVGTDRGSDPVGEGHVYGFEIATGNSVLKYAAGTGVSADLLLDQTRLIAYCANGEVIGLDLQSGKPAWKRKISTADPDRYVPSPALLDHTVFAATLTGEVVALRVIDGELLWRRQVGTGYLQTVALEKDLYVLGSAGVLYRLDKRTGEIVTKMDLHAGPYFVAAPAIASILVEFSDHTLKSIGRDQILWSVTAGGDLTTHKPLVWQDQVIVADKTGTLSSWSLEKGAPRWSTTFQDLKAPITIVSADSQLLYVGTQSGTLYGVDLDRLEHGRE